jgi:hypothetical protein
MKYAQPLWSQLATLLVRTALISGATGRPSLGLVNGFERETTHPFRAFSRGSEAASERDPPFACEKVRRIRGQE